MKKVLVLKDGVPDKDPIPVNELGRMLISLGHTIGEIPMGLQPPFDIQFPFEAPVVSDSEIIYIVKGGYNELAELQRMTKKNNI
jgi:hypothetical protein